MKSGDILFKALCFFIILIVICGSIISIIGTLIKALGMLLMLDITGAKRELELIIRVFKNY